MALPPLNPSPPEPTGTKPRTPNRLELSDEAIRQSDAALIFVKLRKMIASDTQPTDTILGAIAVAAHSLTGGSGAAIAMPSGGEVVCVGRSGETAPDLGDRLNLDSGISGECLRTGVIMRCDDASRDMHVDAEVCRQLGIQSIAVVPLRGQYGRVGVLEAFSTESHAFSEDKMEILGRLAGLAEAAWARGIITETPVEEGITTSPAVVAEGAPEPAPFVSTPVAPVIAPPLSLAAVREALASHWEGRPKWQYAAVAAGTVLAMALAIYGWRAWHKASVASPGQPAASAPGGDSAAPTGAGLAFTPDVIRPAARPSGSQVAGAAKPVSSPAIPDEVVRRRPRAAQSASPDAGDKASSESASDSEEPPLITAPGPDPAALGEALTSFPSLPSMGAPISQGTSGGALIHKVQPVYPAEARRMHVEGKVVIDATVTEEGHVDNLQLVSGDPRLSPAAMDAVRKWRYAPYLLNGKPIPKQTRITISFIAPQ